MTKRLRLAATLALAISIAGCGSDGSEAAKADSKADDIAAGPEEVVGEVSSQETLTLTGRVLDETGAPVLSAMLVLCGQVEGLEVCLQQFATEDGTFQYDELLQGYTHLQVMPYAAIAETGLLYAGLSLVTDLPAPPATYDWGDIILPIIATTTTVVVATGGLYDFGPLSVELPPASASFPDLHPEGPVGVVRVAAGQLPDAFGGEAGYAFYPYDTRLSEPATVRIPVATLADVWDGVAPPQVHVNSTDLGGLYEVAALVDDADVVFEVTELTWIVLRFE